MTTNHSLVLHNWGEKLSLENRPVPEIQAGQVLIKVEASTINPSDSLFVLGKYFQRPLPTVAGLEGCGRVVKTSGGDTDKFLNKRVSFTTTSGAWAEYSVSTLGHFFEIDEDVPVASAASGIVNPLTVIGFIHEFRKNKFTGLIHTAAASSLGRMLNKLCISEKIPLLNIVRRSEQAELLKSEGAEHVLVTEGDWVPKLKEYVQTLKLNCCFDAIAGGEVTDNIIANILIPGTVYIYGALVGGPITVRNTLPFFGGLAIKGFLVFPWWVTVSPQEQKEIASKYSKYLKNELSTTTSKELTLKQIDEALEISRNKPTGGKILLRPPTN